MKVFFAKHNKHDPAQRSVLRAVLCQSDEEGALVGLIMEELCIF